MRPSSAGMCFEQVQKQIASRRRQQKDATTQIFAGLVKCADCGWSMRFGTNRQNKNAVQSFHLQPVRTDGDTMLGALYPL